MSAISRPLPAVGWIGMGAIGLPMAARAAAQGWEVWGFDPDPLACEAAAVEGIRVAADAAEAGARADRFVVCVVRSADEVEEALLGPGGALAAPTAGAARAGAPRCGIVMSSIGARAMTQLATRAPLLDAPILGNPRTAAAGGLTVVASGPPELLAEARPLLGTSACSVVDLGPRPGAAQAMKLVSQLLQIVGMVATIEGMALAEAHDVSEAAVLAVLEQTAPSWTVEHWAYALDLWRRRDPGTSLGLFAKDLAAAVSDGEAVGLELPLTSHALRLLEAQLDRPQGPLP